MCGDEKEETQKLSLTVGWSVFLVEMVWVELDRKTVEFFLLFFFGGFFSGYKRQERQREITVEIKSSHFKTFVYRSKFLTLNYISALLWAYIVKKKWNEIKTGTDEGF